MEVLRILLLLALFFACVSCTPEESALPIGDADLASDEWIVFSSGRSGEGDIYALNPQTGETVLVAGSPAPEGTVRYDAFADRVVYHRYEDDPPRAILVTQEGDLFEDPNGDVAPAWSPASSRIVYVAERDGQEDIYIARADGAEEEQFTNDSLVERYPSWSPDGTAVVFALKLETGWDLHVLESIDEEPEVKRLTFDGVYVGHPSWSPDGNFIAFDTMVDDQAEIAMLELATGAITRLTNRSGNDLIPSWSSDGQYVAFGGEPEPGNWDLWMVDVQSLEIKRLTTQATFDGGPVFVPGSAIR